jgi:ABC-type dipeptide/oligopeptide/nickel transport system permease component/ABC-type transport system substrate-binding protein
MYKILKYTGLLLLTGCFFFGCLYFWSDVLKPDMEEEPIYYSPEEIEFTENSRDVSFTEDEVFKIQEDVDYSEGKSGRWYPKSESPLLSELVDEGKLPPLAERVGSEPVVFKGVDSIGSYGGTWFQVKGSAAEVGTIESFYSGSTLVRFSPFGYPIVPHVAKGWDSSPDKREWTFYLRKGMKWSDGHPFTANDILYWWEKEVKLNFYDAPDWMKIGGRTGEIVKIDDYAIKFVFPHPYGSFLARLARANIFSAPEHYMKKYHPVIGDDALIEATLKERRLPSRRSLVTILKLWNNPEYPRLWPWIYRTYKANPPHVFVRNPYYWAVDTEGNQLPYLDQIYIDATNYKLVPIAAASGAISFKIFDSMDLNYTLLMSQRDANDYEVYHWFPATRSRYLIYPNFNLWVDPDNPATQMKHDLINDKRFRQALSLAINRQEIIDIVYSGMAEPAQLSPGRESFFHHEKLHKSFTAYAPERANKLLDEIGLTGRDNGGYRTFKDGTRMSWFYDVPEGEDEGPTELIIEDWSRIGIRAIHRKPALALFGAKAQARKLEFSIWASDGEFIPIINPIHFVALTSFQALGYAIWYLKDGLSGNPEATQLGGIEPPIDHPIRRSIELLEAVYGATTREVQREYLNEIFDIAAENLWSINVNTPPPHPVVVKNGFKNVPRKAAYSGIFSPPSNAGLETFYIEEPDNSPGAVAKIKNEIINISPAPYSGVDGKHESKNVNRLTVLIKYLFIGGFVCATIMVGMRHPYIGRRLLIMVPSLLIISIISFAIIQLPPGNFLETKILQLQLKGGHVNLDEIKELREIYQLDKPIAQQYAHWLGLYWFTSFDKKDQGLLQGHMGLSMENQVPVNEVVGDRILLTFLISLGTILFTWVIAFPIGVYSAVRQYTLSDYVFTLIGFIGMSVPSFLLALILLYWSGKYLGINITGLFSPEYAIQPEWTRGKIVDLLQHIWVPIVVLGVTGTAGMIRVMRGNLLDELKKPYVITAMAKGVRPFKLLMKYPVRLALNPFISGIGGIFPSLVSGGAIVAMVLSLPTVGPLMLNALMMEDMYMAGSMLMILSLLGILGTLVSDLLLLWLDPRIRMEGGAR